MTQQKTMFVLPQKPSFWSEFQLCKLDNYFFLDYENIELITQETSSDDMKSIYSNNHLLLIIPKQFRCYKEVKNSFYTLILKTHYWA